METSLTDLRPVRNQQRIKEYPWFAAGYFALWRSDPKKYPLPAWAALALRCRLASEGGRWENRTPGPVAENPAAPCPRPEQGPPASESSIELIERFIAGGEHRITPDDDTPDQLPALDAPPTAPPDGMATERLAEIYLSQGLPQKAIEVYARLGLLNPKKSVYFAELIARIREKENKK